MRPRSPRAWMGGGRGLWVVTLADVDVVLALLDRAPPARAVAEVLADDVDSPRVRMVLELLDDEWELPCSAC